MAVHYTTTIEYGTDTIADVRKRLTQNAGSAKSKASIFSQLITEFRSLLGGTLKGRGYVRTQAASACASQTVTVAVASGVDNTSTLVIGGTTLTEKAAPANESQYAKGTTNTTLRDNLINAINAHSVISKYCRAYAVSAAVFRITCKVPGLLGNFVAISAADASVVVGAATLAGGASDASYGYSFGYTPST